MANLNDGPYRLTCVGETGISTTRKIMKWSTAYREFEAFKRLKHIRYACLVELSEDSAFHQIREEYCTTDVK